MFPDQRQSFLTKARRAIAEALNREIKLLTPLFEFGKADVVKLATEKGIANTYSCHAGDVKPCGACIACLEYGPSKEED